MKNKTVMFVKKEPLLPDFGIFSKLNDIYWKFVFNFFVLNIIKKHQNDNLLIICDYQNKVELENRGIKSKTFGEYVRYYDQEEKYVEAKKLAEKWGKYDSIQKVMNYRGLNLWYLFKEGFIFWLVNPLYQISMINKVISQEKPINIIAYSRKTLAGKCFDVIAKRRKIGIKYYSPPIIDYFMNGITSLIDRNALNARFHKIPGVIRREFVKTGNLNKIKLNKRNILALGFDKLHYSRIEGVAKEILKSKEDNVVMLTVKTPMQNELKQQGLNFVSFGDFITPDMGKRIDRKNNEIIKLWNNLKEDPKFRGIFKYKNEDLWEIIKEDLDLYFSIRFKWIMYYIETSNALLKRLNINLVATICDLMMNTRSVVMTANSKSIPTLLVQQGLQVDDSGRFFLPLTCDKMALWGLSDKKYMEKFGVKGERLVVTGSSLHDNVSIKKISDRKGEELFEKLKLDKNKKTIMLASQAFEGLWGEKTIEEIIELLVTSLKDSADKQLIIKLHPREEDKMPKKIVERYNAKNVAITKKEFNIDDIINISDVMITINSTCIYDAILLNKPVITVNLIKLPEKAGYVESGACIGVYKKEDFENALNKALDKKFGKKLAIGRRRFIKEHFYKVDGKAGERIARLINKMIREKNERKNIINKSAN